VCVCVFASERWCRAGWHVLLVVASIQSSGWQTLCYMMSDSIQLSHPHRCPQPPLLSYHTHNDVHNRRCLAITLTTMSTTAAARLSCSQRCPQPRLLGYHAHNDVHNRGCLAIMLTTMSTTAAARLSCSQRCPTAAHLVIFLLNPDDSLPAAGVARAHVYQQLVPQDHWPHVVGWTLLLRRRGHLCNHARHRRGRRVGPGCFQQGKRFLRAIICI
jgi:hypothetical protein